MIYTRFGSPVEITEVLGVWDEAEGVEVVVRRGDGHEFIVSPFADLRADGGLDEIQRAIEDLVQLEAREGEA